MANLRKSYKEAKKALEIGELFMGGNKVFLYSELGIYRLLFMIDKKEEVIEFCTDTIGSLLEYDKKNDDNLCNCLEVFLVNNGNIAKTSKDLYVHPNTLAYRLKKISVVLGKDINDSKTRFNLYFALMIKKLFIDR
jgi:purine catabolism regulator